jgi:predicted N-acetyltransferase YhbS
MIPDAVRLFAEETDSFLPDPEPPSRRIRDDRFLLFLGPTPFVNFVSCVRVGDADVPGLVDEVRARVGPDRRRIIWVVGPSCAPADLAARLEAFGFVPAEKPPFEPVVTAMALTSPPDTGGTEAVEIRTVETYEDFLLFDRIAGASFGEDERDRAAFAEAAPQRFAAFQARQDHIRLLASIDGSPVATGAAIAGELGLLLGGAGTLPEARGRGAYRALVRWRWDEAVRRGTPALVILAGAMSRPILERLGFERVCELSVLLDPESDDEAAG